MYLLPQPTIFSPQVEYGKKNTYAQLAISPSLQQIDRWYGVSSFDELAVSIDFVVLRQTVSQLARAFFGLLYFMAMFFAQVLSFLFAICEGVLLTDGREEGAVVH
jgi:hypothetical protein